MLELYDAGLNVDTGNILSDDVVGNNFIACVLRLSSFWLVIYGLS